MRLNFLLAATVFAVLIVASATAATTVDTSDITATPPRKSPAEVIVGMYLVRVFSLSLKTNQFSVDGYIWYRWIGTLDPKPCDTFEIVYGSIDRKEKCDDKRERVHEKSRTACVTPPRQVCVSSPDSDLHRIECVADSPERVR
jgi:hypothetical protein